MKIQAILSQTNKSDILKLNGNILEINGKDYDLDNLESPSIEEDADNTQFFIDNQCYKDLSGEHIKIYVDNKHFFLFINDNYLLFHDKDLNGEIDLSELADLINCYNLSEENRKIEHLEYKNSFSPKDWVKRRVTCGQMK